jgi:alpha-tubulin suppressor-like RCC1 family protein
MVKRRVNYWSLVLICLLLTNYCLLITGCGALQSPRSGGKGQGTILTPEQPPAPPLQARRLAGSREQLAESSNSSLWQRVGKRGLPVTTPQSLPSNKSTVLISLTAGWNTISFPFKSVTSTSGFTYHLYKFNGSGYEEINPATQANLIDCRSGYWTYVDSAKNVTINGVNNTGGDALVKTNLNYGWNLIGIPYTNGRIFNGVNINHNLETQSLPQAASSQIPPESGKWLYSRIYNYNNSTWTQREITTGTNTFAQKTGYWIWSWQSCELDYTLRLLSLTISPANGALNPTQTLQYSASGYLSDGTTPTITNQVSWYNDNPLAGSIDLNTGLFTAASSINNILTGNITANKDGITSNTATVTIKPSRLSSLSGGYFHSVGLKADGSLKAWGRNYEGQIGDGTYAYKFSPTQISTLSNVISVAAGSYHCLALTADGNVYSWGGEDYGQLGYDRLYEYPHNKPVMIPNLSNIIAIACGSYHSLALKDDGTVWAWGLNDKGQLGDGSTGGFRYTPLQVVGPGGTGYLTNIIALGAGGNQESAGGNNSLAVDSNGNVWAWGDNTYGQLGDGTNDDKNFPVQVLNLSNIRTIACGSWHSLALTNDGSVWAWGRNVYGQLGIGNYIDQNSPVLIPNFTNVCSIACGQQHSLAIKTDGTAWAWGYNNYYGALGYDYPYNHPSPAQITGLSNVLGISGGGYHSLALTTDNKLWSWGWNYWGQLGDGSVNDKHTPTFISAF